MKVVIVGAGIGGLVCAIACRREGIDVTVLERVGAGIQIPPNAARIARQLDYLPHMIAKGIVLDSISYVRYSNGEVLYKMSAGEQMVRKFGDAWLTIHRADYHKILWDAAETAGADLRLGAQVERLSADSVDSVGVFLVGGECITADVIVGADGKKNPLKPHCSCLTPENITSFAPLTSRQDLWSVTRDFVLGWHSPPVESGDMAHRATFKRGDLLALQDSQVEELMNKGAVTCWMGPNRHAVFYPTDGGDSYNLVLLSANDMPQGVHEEIGNTVDMKLRFEGWDTRLTTMISSISHVLKWKLFHHKELSEWTKGPVALLGDACHPTLPYQAQGAAMASEDGAVLGKLLGLLHKSKLPDKHYIPDILKLYESLRKSRTTTNVQGAVSNRSTYHLPDGPQQQWRDACLAAASLYPVQTEFKIADEAYKIDMLGSDSVRECASAFENWVEKHRRHFRASI
ncbi:salicylate hydroxylase [Colletotrichum asianum]|uniref:Salicylate hydroxylase n=1 Tax=Colletotrichum asianum TaxID=702518 RepID=A0A8H3WPT7_9PEZI|nr:salicylate hydroxylase [Colletotrichum asianum]